MKPQVNKKRANKLPPTKVSKIAADIVRVESTLSTNFCLVSDRFKIVIVIAPTTPIAPAADGGIIPV